MSDNARSLLDAVPAFETRIYMLYARREEGTALRLALEVLGRFGVEIPFQPEAEDLKAALPGAEAAVEGMLAEVARSGVEGLPVMRDPERLAVSRLLARTAPMAGWHRIRLFRLMACRLAELSAAHGVSPASAFGCALMAEVRCGELEDVEGGRRVGELGLALARHLGAGAQEAYCKVLYELAVGARSVHPAVLRERFDDLFRRNRESGDLLAAGACGVQHTLAGLLAGNELPEVEAAAREYHGRIHGFSHLMMAHAIEGVARLAGALRGQGTVDRAVAMDGVAPGAVESVRDRLVGPEMMARFLLRQRRKALRAARLALPPGVLAIFPFDFYRCLIFLDGGAEEGGALDACLARLERQALVAPEVYRHKLDLVKAYAERVAGRIDRALALCEEAIESARENQFPHEEAMARELAAELCQELGRERVAAAYRRAAVTAYRRWGAGAKVDQLFEEYPDLAAAPDDPASPNRGASLDVTSLERAQSALQSELDLGRLLRRLMALLLQNAGARRGFLLRGARLRGAGPRDAGQDIVIDASGVDGEVHLPEGLTLDACEEIAAAVVRYVARTRETVVLGEASRDPRFASDPYVERARPRSILCFPLPHRGETVEIAYLENDRSPDVFSPERATSARLLASHAAAALENARLYAGLKQEVETRRRAEAELAAFKDRLEAENVYLQEEIRSHFEEIVGDSDAMRKVLYKVEQVAATGATVLILGETGTGKELIARALHRLSPRRERPLVKVNCAALPTTLIESELFGHEKGAFTGALSRKAGRFELADTGTLFLDEIGDLPLELQAKLLRVLQEGEFERLGGAKTLHVDVRIIAATNRDLEQAMAEGTFRSDLYYRLTVFPIELPPLKDRRGDVPLLMHYFVDRKQAELGRKVDKIPQEVMDRLAAYGWPGNVRELENVVERALILSPGDTLLLEESFGAGREAPASPERLEDLERGHIRSVLEACGWKVKGKGNAAERLGLTPPTLRNRMKKFGIVRPDA